MRTGDYAYLSLLFFLAAFIWLRNTLWMTASEDTLPILVALPVFVWLGWPWRFKETTFSLSQNRLIFAVLFFLFGILSDSTLILTIAWTWLLWEWLSNRLEPETLPSVRKLLIFPLMAFPWIALDAALLGWWFRLSGATVAATTFAFFGADVSQEGTFLLINGLPISVEAACSGLNTLQSMLIAGSAVAYILLGHTKNYWWNIAFLAVIAWLANTLRAIVLILAALLVSPEFALGAFHTWGGWLVLVFMFTVCWLIFSFQERQSMKKAKE